MAKKSNLPDYAGLQLPPVEGGVVPEPAPTPSPPPESPAPGARPAAIAAKAVPGAKDKKKMTVYLDEDAWVQLKQLALDKRTNAHALIVEGINAVFKKNGLKPMA